MEDLCPDRSAAICGESRHLLKIGTLNLRSLCNKFPSIKEFVLENSFSVVGMTETWLQPDYPDDLYFIPGYRLVRHDRVSRAGGVAFYLQNHLNYTVLDKNVSESVEYLIIKTRLKRFTLGLAVVYRPNDLSLSSLTVISDIIVSFLSNDVEKFIIVGDFNVNFLGNSPSSKFLQQLLIQHNCTQLVEEPTRVTEHSESLLDLVITNVNVNCISVQVLPFSLSDHNAVSCTLNIKCDKPILYHKTTRSFKNFHSDGFQLDASSFNWDRIYCLESLDAKVDHFTTGLLDLFDRHAPIKLVTVDNNKVFNPWFTDVLRLLRRMVRKAWRKYVRSRLQGDRSYYTNLRNYYNGALISEKRAYFRSRIGALQGDGRRLWQQFRRWGIGGGSVGLGSLPDYLQNPDLINDHFISSVPSLPRSTRDLTSEPAPVPDGVSFNLRLPDPQDICGHITRLKASVTGPDGISAKMLQLAMPFIAAPLTHIINTSFERGTMPCQWKSCLTFPILKSKSKDEKSISLEDLRPITILPVCLKVAESVFYSQLSDYVETYCLLPSCQSAFRKGYSSTSALCDTIDCITTSIDRGHLTYMSLLDLSKAFDSVDLSLLICKLNHFRICGLNLQWLYSYLDNRVQYTTISTSEGPKWSGGRLIRSGVPQGSILGPLLFSLYIADLPSILQHCKVQLYADDILLHFPFLPHEKLTAEIKINSDLDCLYNWARNSCLLLNPSKCKGILFGSKGNRLLVDKMDIHIGGNQVVLCKFVKTLGVVVDEDLSFTQNVSQLCRRAFYSLKQLLPNKYLLDAQSKLLLSESLVLSILNYADIIYGPYISYFDKHRLQKIQNLCIRFVTYIPPYTHVTPYLRQYNCLKMQERRFLHFAVFLYKTVNSHKPSYLYEKMSRRNTAHNLNLRHVDYTFTVPQHSLSFCKRSFSYLSVYLYNNLLNAEIPNKSAVSLRTALKKRILSNSLNLDISMF